MSKRALSPAPLPVAKRHHSSQKYSACSSTPYPVFDRLYDELILYIFSYLSFNDLCAAQATNRNWSRLATDNQLWKSLYLHAYGRSRLRGGRGFIGRMDGREVKRLPVRMQVSVKGVFNRENGDDDWRDWKWMFRISSNWRTGRCSIEPLSDPSPNNIPDTQSTGHVVLAGPLTIISGSSADSTSPAIWLYKTSERHTSPVVLRCVSHFTDFVSVTALALDQAPPSTHQHTLRLAVCLSTGEFNIFNIDHLQPSASIQKFVYVPSHRSSIMHAAYHHPLLVTLSHSLRLSIYDLSQDTVNHVQTLTTCTSYRPISFVLSNPTPIAYKLVMVYTVPVYPSHWSIAATELMIVGYNDKCGMVYTSSSGPSSLVSEPHQAPMTVSTSRTIRALDVPSGWIDEHKLRAMREQWSRKVKNVSETQTDGKWVILAPGSHPISDPEAQSAHSSLAVNSSTTLQLYRLHFPTSSSRSSRSSNQTPKLTFVRYLHGQTSPVCALALADGRCVSLGTNGCIWVWDLENGTGAEVAPPSASLAPGRANTFQGATVVFDERRIVTTSREGIVIRRFDV